MAYNRTQAQKLCNATEFELFMASLADEVIQLTPAQLCSKVTRTRTLRDKNADLFRRQVTSTRVATGAKRGDTGAANQRTDQKTRLFDETLKRFETRLAKLDAQVAATATKTAAPKKSPTQAAVARAPAKPAAPKKSAVKRAVANVAAKDALPGNPVTYATGKPTLPERSAKAPAFSPTSNAPAAKRATEVSKLVQVRGKNMVAHARSSNANAQAKRDNRP